MANLHLPSSIRVEYGGLYQTQKESFHDLVLVLILAIVFVFLVLLFEFKSFSAPVAILTAAALAISGSFIALFITGITFNISSFMGVIMVIGLVAKNGILLLDADVKFRAAGFSPLESIAQAGRRRLRPILMTALAAAAGMLPLALGMGTGSQMLQPLAIAVIGGILYLAIRRVVLQPLAILHEGAERIGRGEFGHRINLSTNDEVQDLARSFNVMAGRIEESYSGLENKVRERTAQLSNAIEEVEDKARSLYEFSRGMATVSRLSKKVFNAEQPFDQMLERFMRAVDRGLGYKETLLCLVDRKRIWLDVKRDSGLGALLGITSQALAGDGPFAALVRTGKELYVPDISRDPAFRRT